MADTAVGRAGEGVPGSELGSAAPIFVVGTGRSGTTLLAAMLNRHSAISCGPETAFFRLVRPVAARILHDPAWPAEAVEFVASFERDQSGRVLDAYGISPEEIRAELTGRPRSLRSVLEAMVVPYMRRRLKRRWVEKSPQHVLHVEELRRLWPDAFLIRMVRDPRAVAASLLRVPFGPRSAVGSAYLWNRHENASQGFFLSDPCARTIRFEDLLADPETVLRSLCAFLGEAYEDQMLAGSDADRELVAPGEWWKGDIEGPPDPARAAAWRDQLRAIDQERVALVCSEGMRRHDYEGARIPRGAMLVHGFDAHLMDVPELTEPPADAGYVLVGARADGTLRSPLPDLIWGGPGEHRWTTGERGGGVRTLGRLTARLAVARLKGDPVMRVDRVTARPSRRPLLEALGDFVMVALTRRVDPASLPRLRRSRAATVPTAAPGPPTKRRRAAGPRPGRRRKAP
jgi:Sulfotransferase family